MPFAFRPRRTALAAVFASSAFAASTDAAAALYKCVDASGATTYTQTRCPTADARVESVTTVSRGGSSRTGQACGIVRNFAFRTAGAMRRGRSSSDVFSRYGGLDTLSPTAIGIVSHVYEFAGGEGASAARIAELATGRCLSGAYGDVGCGAFPSAFVVELGGCEGAQVFGGIDPRAASARAGFSSAGPEALDQRPARATRTVVGESAGARCRARVRRAIEEVNTDMRATRTVSGQDRLRDRRRALGRDLRDC